MTEMVTYVKDKKRRCRVEVFALGPGATALMASKGARALPYVPGGGIDEGESVIEAASRELQEESGWLAVNHRALPVPGEWVFKGTSDAWFKECGWEEEHNAASTCEAVRFAPNEKYGSEGDGDVFTLRPLEQLFDETQAALPYLFPRLRFMAVFRLAALEVLMRKSDLRYQMEALALRPPSYVRW